MSFWDEKEAKRLFQKLPFYKTFIEKPRIKLPKNIDLLQEISFYDEVSTEKTSKTFNMQEVRSKHKENRGIEFAPVYFNSTTKTVINSDEYMLDKSFQ